MSDVSEMNDRAANAGPGPDLVYRRMDAPDAQRLVHPDLAEVRAPGRFDVVSHDATALLSRRLASYGASIEKSQRFGFLATVEGVAIAASVAAWSRPTNVLDRGPHTRGIVRARVSSSVAGLRVTRRSLLALRTWRSKLGLMKELAATDPAMEAFVVTGHEETASLTLSDDVRRALLAMRTILTHVAIGGGTVEVAWRTSTFDESSVLPSAVLVAALEIARAAR